MDERKIEQVVRSFYARVRQDALLAPVFEERISDWEPHLQRIAGFWSAALLQTGRYTHPLMQMHRRLEIDARHFDRWLELFEETVRELCAPEMTARFLEHAHRVAQSLELGIAYGRGIILEPGSRLAAR